MDRLVFNGPFTKSVNRAPVSSFYACSSFPLVLAHWALPTAFHPRYSEKCVESCQLVCFRCCGESAGCIV